jgi:hypothetical protein
MRQIPIAPVPVQTFATTLGSQACQINLYQKRSGLYIDLYVNNAPILIGQVCEDRALIVRDEYLGFVGDLAFFDATLAGDDPYYTGFGSQFAFFYLEAGDVVYDQPFSGIGAVAGNTYA